MLSRRALSDVWSGGAGASGAGAARTERFLHVGQALKLDAVLRGDAPTSLVSTGQFSIGDNKCFMCFPLNYLITFPPVNRVRQKTARWC